MLNHGKTKGVDPKAKPHIIYLKIAGSVLLAFHVLAIAIAPASVPPAPRVAGFLFSAIRPYLELAFLNHGYHFFAPNPGASSLIEYTAIDLQGQRQWGRIPDREQHWPRLFYHRHFMLTEVFGSLAANDDALTDEFASTFAQQIAKRHNSQHVELVHVLHNLRTRDEILDNRLATDVETFDLLAIGLYDASGQLILENSTSKIRVAGNPNVEKSDNSLAPGLTLAPPVAPEISAQELSNVQDLSTR